MRLLREECGCALAWYPKINHHVLLLTIIYHILYILSIINDYYPPTFGLLRLNISDFTGGYKDIVSLGESEGLGIMIGAATQSPLTVDCFSGFCYCIWFMDVARRW